MDKDTQSSPGGGGVCGGEILEYLGQGQEGRYSEKRLCPQSKTSIIL